VQRTVGLRSPTETERCVSHTLPACNVLEKTDDSEYGKFGWVIDPEGNKVELWQPPEGQ
jgi:hypothetical protein